LFEQYMASKGNHDNDSWWNGFYVALLKKGDDGKGKKKKSKSK